MTKPAVVLLHGLARSSRSMAAMAQALTEAGFNPWVCDYPSTTGEIPALARSVAERIHARLGDQPVYAVTHSLGGIVLRHLRDDRIKWRRAVMLAPPNNGSAVAAAVQGHGGAVADIFRHVFGAAGGELAGARAMDRPWPFPPAPFAVIAGTRKWGRNPTSILGARIFGADVDHDGTVAVDETRLPGMAAFETVDASHTVIMDNPRAIALTVRFLQRGFFAGA